MTNQNFTADVTPEDMEHARSYVQDFLDATCAPDRTLAVARVLQALLPPPPPTLADMTDEERGACQWMQCEVTNSRGKWILATPSDEDGDAGLVSSYGDICWLLPGRVTPRPDLPRMEWPDADQGGEEVTKVDYVSVAGGRTAYGPWTVARLRKKPDTVPLNTLAVGSVWADADALTRACEESGRDQIAVTDCDGDVYVWGANQDDWRDLHPIQKYAPFTIIHAGKKADQ